MCTHALLQSILSTKNDWLWTLEIEMAKVKSSCSVIRMGPWGHSFACKLEEFILPSTWSCYKALWTDTEVQARAWLLLCFSGDTWKGCVELVRKDTEKIIQRSPGAEPRSGDSHGIYIRRESHPRERKETPCLGVIERGSASIYTLEAGRRMTPPFTSLSHPWISSHPMAAACSQKHRGNNSCLRSGFLLIDVEELGTLLFPSKGREHPGCRGRRCLQPILSKSHLQTLFQCSWTLLCP